MKVKSFLIAVVAILTVFVCTGSVGSKPQVINENIISLYEDGEFAVLCSGTGSILCNGKYVKTVIEIRKTRKWKY